ncbi:MAG TPA: hypothetical protein PKZ83_16765 [bacterium]|mgnify:CR=1 FL=1|nr:hypothetical protein [bacterium]HQJ66284.1 hypothetical protein [bacterium]
MIWTSYFRKVAKNQKTVMITRTVPKGYKGARFVQLAPPYHLFGLNDPELFRKRYREEVLAKLDAKEIAKQFDGMILTCYEGPGKFCHREVVAEWLRKEAGIKVQEWQGDQDQGNPKPPKKRSGDQISLLLF